MMIRVVDSILVFDKPGNQNKTCKEKAAWNSPKDSALSARTGMNEGQLSAYTVEPRWKASV
jgi:hypothetical protein